jgi:hypothetical protein
MYVALDHEQVDMLRETVQHALKELRIESARADSHDFREMLHHREAVMEQILAKISDGPAAVIT